MNKINKKVMKKINKLNKKQCKTARNAIKKRLNKQKQ